MTVVVFVTDGYPTECDTDVSHIQELVGEYYLGVSGAYNARGKPGIRTYIIGVAVDKFNLNAVAQAGGTGQATIVDSAGGVNAFVSAMVNITDANFMFRHRLPDRYSIPVPFKLYTTRSWAALKRCPRWTRRRAAADPMVAGTTTQRPPRELRCVHVAVQTWASANSKFALVVQRKWESIRLFPADTPG